MDAGRVSTFSSFCAEHFAKPCVGHGSWHLRLRSTRSEERTALVWYRSSPSSCKRRCRFQDGTVALGVVPAKQGLLRIPPDWVAQGITSRAQYEGVKEAIIARTNFCFLFVSAPWSDSWWSPQLCSVWQLLYVSSSRTPFGMADSTSGRLYGFWFHCVHAHGPLEVCAI